MGQLSDGPASSVPQSASTFFSPNKQQQLNGSGGGLSSKTTTSKNLKKFPFGASAAALLCDYLEKILVWTFADSGDAGAGPHAAGKPAGDPHYFLTGAFGPVASETAPASGLTVSGSIPVSLLQKWGLSRSQFPFCFSRLIICFLLDRSIFATVYLSKQIRLNQKLVFQQFCFRTSDHPWGKNAGRGVKNEILTNLSFSCPFLFSKECLNGEFVQVVPNPRFSPVSEYHW